MVCPHGRTLLIGDEQGGDEYFDLLRSYGGRIERVLVEEARRSEMFCDDCRLSDRVASDGEPGSGS